MEWRWRQVRSERAELIYLLASNAWQKNSLVLLLHWWKKTRPLPDSWNFPVMDPLEKSRWLADISEECFKIVPVNNKIVGKLQLNRAKQGSKDSSFPPPPLLSKNYQGEHGMPSELQISLWRLEIHWSKSSPSIQIQFLHFRVKGKMRNSQPWLLPSSHLALEVPTGQKGLQKLRNYWKDRAWVGQFFIKYLKPQHSNFRIRPSQVSFTTVLLAL